MKKEVIEPWGVNIPYIFLAMVYWALGGIFFNFHPYFMLIGAYSLFFGMILRLFFPAKKYLILHLATLVSLSAPIPYFQVIASVFLTSTEIWAIHDVKNYGSKFPINFLVLLSPPASIISWLLYPNFWILLIPLMLYTLGVNIGVFHATLNTRVIFGLYQFPLLLFILLVGFFKELFTGLGLLYFLTLFQKGLKMNRSALVTMVYVTVSPILGYFISYTHAFTLGVMSPLFFSCITYSISRYNYDKVYIPSSLSFLSLILHNINLGVSAIVWIVAVLFFLYLIKDNFYMESIKTGMSRRWLKSARGKK
ncbi:MAG: hypothetical protein RXR43_13095 [Sulfolobus sp.]